MAETPIDEPGEYLKFRKEVLKEKVLGSLSSDDLSAEIWRWCTESKDSSLTPELVTKFKAKLRRQHKREARQWAMQERGGKEVPVNVEEVETALSEHTKERSPPEESGPTAPVSQENEEDLPILVGPLESFLRDAYCNGLMTGLLLACTSFFFGILFLKVLQ